MINETTRGKSLTDGEDKQGFVKQQKEQFITIFSAAQSIVMVAGVVFFILSKTTSKDYKFMWAIPSIFLIQFAEGIIKKEFIIRGKIINRKQNPKGYRSVAVIYISAILATTALLLL